MGPPLGLEERGHLVDEHPPRWLVGEKDVVATLERDKPRAGDPRRHAHRVVERRRTVADRLQNDGRRRDARQLVMDVDLLSCDAAGHGVRGRRRHPLKIVEPAHLLLGRVRDEPLREDATEVRILLRPPDADHAAVRLFLHLVVRRQGDRLATDGAVEDQPAHTLRVRDRVGHGNGGAAGHSQHREAVQSGRVQDRFEVADTRLDREIIYVPIGHPETALVITDDRGDVAELVEEMSPHRALPVVLEVAQPARDDD